MDIIEIKQTTKQVIASEAMLKGSEFTIVCIDGARFTDVSATNVKISDANLSDLEIEFAQLGGAYIHDIGLPPKGHPSYEPGKKQRPLRIENCDLNGSTITNCDLSSVTIVDCNTSGMTINGILIDDLLKSYKG